jgi:hypothetical protein
MGVQPVRPGHRRRSHLCPATVVQRRRPHQCIQVQNRAGRSEGTSKSLGRQGATLGREARQKRGVPHKPLKPKEEPNRRTHRAGASDSILELRPSSLKLSAMPSSPLNGVLPLAE